MMLHKLPYKQKLNMLHWIINIILLIVLVVFVWSVVNSFYKQNNFSFQKLIIENLLQLDVKPMVLYGQNSNQSSYYITAKKMQNYIANFFYDQDIIFQSPIIIIKTKKLNFDIHAKDGLFIANKNQFKIQNDVLINTSNNIAATTEIAYINLDTLNIFSESKIYFKKQNINAISRGVITKDSLNKVILKGPFMLTDNLQLFSKYDQQH